MRPTFGIRVTILEPGLIRSRRGGCLRRPLTNSRCCAPPISSSATEIACAPIASPNGIFEHFDMSHFAAVSGLYLTRLGSNLAIRDATSCPKSSGTRTTYTASPEYAWPRRSRPACSSSRMASRSRCFRTTSWRIENRCIAASTSPWCRLESRSSRYTDARRLKSSRRSPRSANLSSATVYICGPRSGGNTVTSPGGRSCMRVAATARSTQGARNSGAYWAP
jgi:hypothetical protein